MHNNYMHIACGVCIIYIPLLIFMVESFCDLFMLNDVTLYLAMAFTS